ncbi:MAG: hypothetical protein PVH68_05380 [Armatimonadota bacterium]|jgi:hypothetical protein
MPKKEGSEKCHKNKEPGTCTPQEIKECHGSTKGHPCEGAKK